MTIHYLTNKEINRQQWNAIITADPTGLPYAQSWYLDATTHGQWDALITDDYQLLMPLPWNRIVPGIPQVFAPLLSQQLGLFGQSVSDRILLDFIQAIPTRFKRVKLPLHRNLSQVKLPGQIESFREKKNLILNLHQSYENIHSNYHKSLRKRIRAATNRSTITKGGEVMDVFHFYKQHLSSKIKLPDSEWQFVADILDTICKKMETLILEVRNAEGERTGMGLFLITPQRVINLFGASSEQGKKDFSMHLMLDAVIQQYAGQPLHFDFEGSDILGIYNFFKSFGSIEANISVYERNNLPWIMKKVIGN